MGHAVEPLVDGAGDVALARHADLGETLQAPLELGQLGGLRLGLAPPSPHMHDQRDGESDQRQDGKRGERQHDEDRVEREGADLNGLQGHGRTV